jgi:hypothetical protein
MGTHSTGKGIHISSYSKTAQDCIVYFKRKEDATDENNKDLIKYGSFKTKDSIDTATATISGKEDLIQAFEQCLENLTKEFKNVPKLWLLLNKDKAKESLITLSFREQKKILEQYLTLFKDSLKTKQRVSSDEDELLAEAADKLKALERKLKAERDLALKKFKAKTKTKEAGHYRSTQDVIDEL